MRFPQNYSQHMGEEKKFAKVPPRLKLFSNTDPYYFITFNTYERKKILNHPGIHTAFISYAEKGAISGAWVGRYVIMPDHVHLFLWLNDNGPNLSDWVKGLKRSLGDALKDNQLSQPYWQKGFFDHVIRNSESDQQKWNYVRMNPVRAELVERPEEWEFAGEINRL